MRRQLPGQRVDSRYWSSLIQMFIGPGAGDRASLLVFPLPCVNSICSPPDLRLAHIRIVGGLALSNKDRLLLIQVGDEQLLISASPGRCP